VIGTFLIIWLALVPLVWLLWAASLVFTLLSGLTARIRERGPPSNPHENRRREFTLIDDRQHAQG